jgi:murein DD-endopeptidase MepM/ murein hydrolase activator NlpD
MEMEKARKAAEDEEKKRLAEVNKSAANTKAPTPSKDENAPAAPTGVSRVKPAAPTANPDLLLTPTDMVLASNFEGNKGRLPWPVDRGYISDHFGTHPHPVEQKVMIENNGVDIQTTEDAPVKVVFGGVVSKVFSTMGSAQIIMVKHGNYFTVYNGLGNVSVKEGQTVKARQAIGHVVNNDENVPTFNFQIWKSGGKKANIKLNPEAWIGKAH